MKRFDLYLETALLVEAVKMLDPTLAENFIIIDSGDKSRNRYTVWSFAEKGHPRVIDVGGDFDLYKLMERYYVNKKDVYPKDMLPFIKGM